MEGTIAAIMLFAGNFAPRGWAFCEGQTLSIASNQPLFSLLGVTYGGDGKTTFNLPNISHENPNLHYIICLQGTFPSRS